MMMKKDSGRRLKAHSLIYALLITVLVSLTLFSFIQFEFLTKVLSQKYRSNKRVLANVESGVNYYLGMNSQPDSIRLDLYGDLQDSVALKRTSWGLFDVISSRAFSATFSSSAAVLVASKAHIAYPDALYLADRNSPLSLCGNTIIKGNAYLPEAGLKRAYIEGKTYSGEKLLYGTSSLSASDMPNPRPEINERFLALSSSNEIGDAWVSDFDSLRIPFTESTKVLQSAGSIYLHAQQVLGNVIIRSDSEIIVSSQAYLEDVILVAPSIHIMQGFRGRLQAFASDGIVVSEDVHLAYPSVLVLKSVWDDKEIEISDEVHLQGLVLDISEPQVNSLLKIADAEIHGLVYASNRLEHRGHVKGSVYADEFYLKTPSSVYGNHLLDAVIDRTRLSKEMLLPSIFVSQEQEILTWLD